jgi:putative flippase GtrA
MTFGPSRISAALKSKLHTSTGKRFSRFLLVAAGAVIASQVTLTICLGPVGWTAGKSAIAAWAAGAIVSYFLSRWAWERKGKPNLLKETLPFWIVAVGTAVVLTLATKWANQEAISMDLPKGERLLFVASAYFVANCVTFLTRFVIFHYVLFKDRGSKVSELVSELPASERPGASSESPVARSESPVARLESAARPEPAQGDGVPSTAVEGIGSEPFAAAGSAGRGNGSSAWAGTAAERSPGRRPAPAVDDTALPEPGTRR